MAVGFETVLKRVWLSHFQDPIVPVKSGVQKPQLDFGFIRDANSRRLGVFFEATTAALYGGRIKNYVRVNGNDTGDNHGLYGENGNRSVTGSINIRGNGIMPDVLDEENRRMFEAKAISIGRNNKCQLRDEQIERYKYLQSIYPDFSVYFAFYRYSFDGDFSGKNGNEEELYKALSEKTRFSVVAPLSLVLRMHSFNGRGTYRYCQSLDGGEPAGPVSTHVLAGTFCDFLDNPREVIERVGLDPLDYVVRRRMSPDYSGFNGSAKPFFAYGNRLKRFPVLWIEDRDHAKWMERFGEIGVQSRLFRTDSELDEVPF